MYKRKVIDTTNKITVGIEELQGMLGLGKTKANEIGEEANAVIRIGSRKLYNVERIKKYMEAKTGGEQDENI